MSYDVSISVKAEGIDYYIELCDLGNITWNARDLILYSSGWDINNEAPNGAVRPWIEKIERGIQELSEHPEKYKKYESPNGWGTIRGTLKFYNGCLINAQHWLSNTQFDKELQSIAVIYVD